MNVLHSFAFVFADDNALAFAARECRLSLIRESVRESHFHEMPQTNGKQKRKKKTIITDR